MALILTNDALRKLGVTRFTISTSPPVDKLDLARLPGLVEPGFQRTVQAQDHEPALAGHRLDPVRLLARRRFRSEPDRA